MQDGTQTKKRYLWLFGHTDYRYLAGKQCPDTAPLKDNKPPAVINPFCIGGMQHPVFTELYPFSGNP